MRTHLHDLVKYEVVINCMKSHSRFYPMILEAVHPQWGNVLLRILPSTEDLLVFSDLLFSKGRNFEANHILFKLGLVKEEKYKESNFNEVWEKKITDHPRPCIVISDSFFLPTPKEKVQVFSVNLLQDGILKSFHDTSFEDIFIDYDSYKRMNGVGFMNLLGKKNLHETLSLMGNWERLKLP